MIRVSGESHAAVARSTFPSQNVKKQTFSDHFLKLRCWKITRRCGEKRISKSKCTKHCMFGPLFEVEMLKNCTLRWREAYFQVKMLKKTEGLRPLFKVQMLKNCTPLWREVHFEVKMYKTCQVRTTFWSSDVEKLHAAVARSTFPSQNVIRKSKCTKYLCFAAFFQVQMSKN